MNNTSVKIVLEHKDFIVADKPSDYSFHLEDSQHHSEDQNSGLQKRLVEQTKQALWPVHRLDKITSGLVIFAKSQESAAEFGRLFEQRLINKTYIAISDKKPKKKMGTIKGDMIKSRSGSWKLCQSSSNPAITQFTSQSLIPGIRLFVIKPYTGKTHQIRVALKSLGAPILGDTRYKGTAADRGYLHAYSLSFDWHNEKIELTCPPTSGKEFLLPQLSEKLLSQKL